MLHKETIQSNALSLLRDLMSLEIFEKFSLVGRTALALKYGHRESVDLDLFCNKKFDHSGIVRELEKKFPNLFKWKAKRPDGEFFVLLGM